MARIIRRHELKTLIHATLLIALVITLIAIFSGDPQPAVAQTPTSPKTDEPRQAIPVDPVVYGDVQQIRQAAALTTRDLAAMGCSQSQAEQVLTRLREWAEQNQATLQTKRSAERKARQALRASYRQMNLGPRDESVINNIPRQRDAFIQANRQVHRCSGFINLREW